MRTPLPPVAAVIGFIDAINRSDVDRMVALMSPDHRLQVLGDAPLDGREANRAAWHGYTQRVLPLIGRVQSREWADTGRFLGPNISAFYEDHPLDEQLAMWRRAGIRDVRSRSMSFGVGVITWGTRE